MRIRKEDEMGMITVEATIWIPFLCIVILILLKIFFQWTEIGIVQGELLVQACSSMIYDEDDKEITEEENTTIYFLKNPIWKVEEEKQNWKEVFTADLQKPFKKQVTRKIQIQIEHPIKKLRRRERIGEALQEIGLS